MRIANRIALGAALALALVSRAAFAHWNPDPAVGGTDVGDVSDLAGTVAPAVDSDGQGGLCFAWTVYISGAVRVQHVDRFGNALWHSGGVGVAINKGSSVQVVSDGAGGAVVLWSGVSSSSVEVTFAQRVSAAGTALWGSATVLGGTSQPKQHLRAISDGAGGAFVTWSEFNLTHGIPGPTSTKVAHVTGAGAAAWVVAASSAGGTQVAPSLCADGAGGLFVTWVDTRSGTHLYAQRYSSAGSPAWAANGIQLDSFMTFAGDPEICADGSGGAVVAWTDGSATPHIYAKRVDGAGNLIWGPVNTSGLTGSQSALQVAADAAGGAFVCWSDTRSGTMQIYAQHLNSSGLPQWSTYGVPASVTVSTQDRSGIVPDGTGGALLGWTDSRAGIDTELIGQHLDASGNRVFAADLAISTAPGAASSQTMTTDGAGGALVGWNDHRAASSWRGVVQRIDPFGYRGNPAPDIEALLDVANDQGGRLKLAWRASDIDQMYTPIIDRYDVDRWSGTSWTPVDSVFAGPLPSYSILVHTLSDSTAPGSPFTVVRVRAIAVGGGSVWFSSPDSARSVDNLPPASVVISGTYDRGLATLHWTAAPDPDLAGYRIYRSTSGPASPAAGERIAEVGGTSFVDVVASPAAYVVTSVDRHGNESPASAWTAPGFEPRSGLPPALALAAPSPNPARGAVTLAFQLPAAAPAELQICDLAGRVVRRLAGGTWAAGEHRIGWDLNDERGRRVAPGAYFARLRTGGVSPTREVVVLK